MEHPGQIVFVDLDAGTERVAAADEVPETIAFVEVEGVPVPVVRVESRKRGDLRVIRSYSASGTCLQTTRQAPRKPR